MQATAQTGEEVRPEVSTVTTPHEETAVVDCFCSVTKPPAKQAAGLGTDHSPDSVLGNKLARACAYAAEQRPCRLTAGLPGSLLALLSSAPRT